jgi:hypothetical protein
LAQPIERTNVPRRSWFPAWAIPCDSPDSISIGWAESEYRQQAETIRTLAAQVSLLEAKLHLLEAAHDLEELAAGEEHR